MEYSKLTGCSKLTEEGMLETDKRIEGKVPLNRIYLPITGWCKSIRVVDTEDLPSEFRLEARGVTYPVYSENGVLNMERIIQDILENVSRLCGEKFSSFKDLLGRMSDREFVQKLFLYTTYGYLIAASNNPEPESKHSLKILENSLNLRRLSDINLVFDCPLKHSSYDVNFQEYELYQTSDEHV